MLVYRKSEIPLSLRRYFIPYTKLWFDVPKPSKREREEGLNNLKDNYDSRIGNGLGNSPSVSGKRSKPQKNIHPTVKPIKLMCYLIELGCHKDGIVLDPFVGSGTTCIAAQRLNRKYIGIELNEEYINIASARLGNVEVVRDFNVKKEKQVEKITKLDKLECNKLDIKCGWRSMDNIHCLSKKGCRK